MVTFDIYGNYVLTVVSTDLCLFDSKAGNGSFVYNRVRWNPCSETPIFALKYCGIKFNLFDTIKQKLIHNEPLDLDAKNSWWIDWCRDGNILASGGSDRNIKIYDKRVGDVIRTLADHIHNGDIWSVRWSPCGKFLATASEDGTASVIDMATGTKIYTGLTSDAKPAFSVCFQEIY